MNEEEREQGIQELMKNSGMTRKEAEFAIAVENGDLPGDVIVVDDTSDGISRTE